MSSQVKLMSYNVNGIRAALRKGFFDWLKKESPDMICLQELKATPDQFEAKVFETLGYHCFWKPAEKKGYSGVALLTKIKPDNIYTESGMSSYDSEGRILRADFGDTTLLSCYFPSGTSGAERQSFKMKFLSDFSVFINSIKSTRRKLIVSGDYNICHHPIDIHNPAGNKHSSGFLPEERAWLTDLFSGGWTDTFRHFNQEPHQYTWWSQFANARANNKGWRIDYHNCTEEMKSQLVSSRVLMDVVHSDHCPVELVFTM